MTAFTISLEPVIHINDEQFYQLCEENPELKLERNASGELIVMPPTGGETGRSNSKFNLQIGLWNEQTELGEAFDSSTGFTLPNKADRSPDASWVEKSRWEALTPQQREKFIPLCPDFAVEILSPTDSLKKTQEKMQEYMREPGVKLGWLIDRKNPRVYIYRPGLPEECLENPATVSGDPVLPGFVLNMSKIW